MLPLSISLSVSHHPLSRTGLLAPLAQAPARPRPMTIAPLQGSPRPRQDQRSRKEDGERGGSQSAGREAEGCPLTGLTPCACPAISRPAPHSGTAALEREAGRTRARRRGRRVDGRQWGVGGGGGGLPQVPGPPQHAGSQRCRSRSLHGQRSLPPPPPAAKKRPPRSGLRRRRPPQRPKYIMTIIYHDYMQVYKRLSSLALESRPLSSSAPSPTATNAPTAPAAAVLPGGGVRAAARRVRGGGLGWRWPGGGFRTRRLSRPSPAIEPARATCRRLW